MCKVLKVSRSGYYKWVSHDQSDMASTKEKIQALILYWFDKMDAVYGSHRMAALLNREGIDVSQSTVARYMRALDLKAKLGRKSVKTTNSNHPHPKYPNKLAQGFDVTQMNTAWTADITYIWTDQGWMYLATIMDLFSRKIIGWAMHDEMDAGLCIHALKQAIRTRRPATDGTLLHHSDQGQQYASRDYTDILKDRQIEISMSRKGDCYDNACTESFHATIKKEFIYRRYFKTKQDARAQVEDYIFGFYNVTRLHSTLGYVSPIEFESSHSGPVLTA